VFHHLPFFPGMFRPFASVYLEKLNIKRAAPGSWPEKAKAII